MRRSSRQRASGTSIQPVNVNSSPTNRYNLRNKRRRSDKTPRVILDLENDIEIILHDQSDEVEQVPEPVEHDSFEEVKVDVDYRGESSSSESEEEEEENSESERSDSDGDQEEEDSDNDQDEDEQANDEELEEEMENEEEQDPNPRPRRSRRLESSGYKPAFDLLRHGDVDGFLNAPIMQQWLLDSRNLIKNFGHGTHHATVNYMWMVAWKGLLSSKVGAIFTDDDRCVACGFKRYLTYRMYEARGFRAQFEENEFRDANGYLGIMGTDCYEVKFMALWDFVNACLSLCFRTEEPGFNQTVTTALRAANVTIREAPAVMAERYKERYNSKPDTSISLAGLL